MKKVSFYRLGDSWIGFKAFIDKLGGCEVIPPPPPSKQDLEFAYKHSPDNACLPYKVMLAEFKAALDAGADTIAAINTTSSYACRYEDYLTGIHSTLKRLGYEFELVRVGSKNPLEIREHFKALNPNATFINGILGLRACLKKITAIDWLEEFCNLNRPFELEKGSFSRLYKKGLELIDEEDNMDKVKVQILEQSKNIPIKLRDNIIRIGFYGDIFSLFEPTINHNLIEELGHRGIFVQKALYLNECLRSSVPGLQRRDHRHFDNLAESAKPYIDKSIGAYALENLGRAVQFAESGYHGAIHMYAFGCMPEIVSKNISSKVSKDFNFPILHINKDEHMSEVGFNTRIEAFIDLLERKQK